MKKVLCFGDSNTYGYIPENGGRYDKNTRWCGILQTLCMDEYKIIEAGCNNRTAFTPNQAGLQQTGYLALPMLLSEDLDFVILNIGINDLQKIYSTTKNDIENGIKNLIKTIKEKSPNAQILLISPSKLTRNVLKGYFSILFDENSITKSEWLSPIYEKIAKEENCKFLDLDKTVKVSELDGLHYDATEHEKIATVIHKLML